MNREEMLKLSNIEIYEMVLQGKEKSFPAYFWNRQNTEASKEVAAELLRYLIDTKYKWTKEEILRNLTREFIKRNKLWPACKIYFGKAINKYCMAAFPGSFMPFEFQNCRVGQGYWKVEPNRIEALRWLFHTKLRWNVDEVRERFKLELLDDNGLLTLRSYYHSIYDVINAVHPGKIQPWELQQSEVPNGTWDVEDNRREAIRWLVSKHGSSSVNEILRIDESCFVKYGLSFLLKHYYSNNAYKALSEVYHGNM